MSAPPSPLLPLTVLLTPLCDVISGAERPYRNSAVPVGTVRMDYETPLKKVTAVASIRASWRVSIGVNTAEIFEIRPGRVDDVRVILQLIRDLATYERAPDEVSATEKQLIEVLFGERPAAEVLLALEGETPVGFAVYFYNFSTWLGRPGLYLEDLFVRPESAERLWSRVACGAGEDCTRSRLRRDGMGGAQLE